MSVSARRHRGRDERAYHERMAGGMSDEDDDHPEELGFVPLIGRPLHASRAPLTGESPVEALGLTPRTYNCLTRAGLRCVGDVLPLSDVQLLALRHLSVECLADLRHHLRGVQV